MKLRFACLLVLVSQLGCSDDVYEVEGDLTDVPRPAASIRSAEIIQSKQFPPGPSRQILFGDLHVHSTFSMDAFQQSLPFLGGEGPHPVADACDYARYCSQLDFWSINDHAMSLTAKRWEMTRNAIRQCNAVSGEVPDTVAFTGWEWTNIGKSIDRHWGHKNVIFPSDADEDLPARAIRSSGGGGPDFNVPFDTASVITEPLKGLLVDSGMRADHWQNLRYMVESMSDSSCDPQIASKDLPVDCAEIAHTPADLFARLDEWSDDYLVIPHGTAWGLYTPPGSHWRKQLRGDMHDERRQTLIEVYSGHGNSEEYRSWRGVAHNEQGEPFCPPPSDGHIACCWQAGEIIREQCTDPGSEFCEGQVIRARANAVSAGASGHLTLTNVPQEAWLNCGQCPDCFLPAFNLRPGMSAQAALAITEPRDDGPGRFRFGFIGASDNHGSRPGTGFKEVQRRLNIDNVKGPDHVAPKKPEGPIASVSKEQVLADMTNVFNRERGESMLYSGGLAAVHSEGRSRKAIWAALKRNEVYGTSGPRILLWFDFLGDAGLASPMGSQLVTTEVPHFRVRAVGALRQKPGCPDFASGALGESRLKRLCGGECYYPTDERHTIARIEIIKVQSQRDSSEDIGSLIQDPWRTFSCDEGGDVCTAEFKDEGYADQARDASYYARAVQSATPTINGGGLRCEYDEQDNCAAVNLCYSNSKTSLDDDCLEEVEHRAWSSPIYLDFQ